MRRDGIVQRLKFGERSNDCWNAPRELIQVQVAVKGDQNVDK